jgi:hypothetical protein
MFEMRSEGKVSSYFAGGQWMGEGQFDSPVHRDEAAINGAQTILGL